MKQKRKLLLLAAALICFISISLVGIDIYRRYSPSWFPESKKEETVLTKEQAEEEAPVLAEQETSEPDIAVSDNRITEEVNEGQTPEKTMQEDVTEEKEVTVVQEPVIPKDIYVPQGKEGKIYCSFPDTEEYLWEYYDESEKQWRPVTENPGIRLTAETDGLNRDVSTLVLQAIPENEERLVRCTVRIPEKEEQSYQAAFHVLPFQAEEIEEVVVPESYHAEAGKYISALDIPVKIIKKDGTEESVTGLSDLFFCVPKNVEGDIERKENGTTVETVTTTTVENLYYRVEAGEKEALLRYRGMTPGMDIKLQVEGEDSLPPEVSITLSEYTVSSQEPEEAVNITAEITAEDNYSSLTRLSYAFLPEGEEPKEKDFVKSNQMDISVENNGKWIAYVKDEAGNIGKSEAEIITVDQKAPVIQSVSLKDMSTGWAKENTIVVNASDKTAMQYCYMCPEQKKDSGWVDENEYQIHENGIWEVRVRDIAGNESSQEMHVQNVDNQPPVILGTTEVKEEEIIETGTLEERVSVTVNGVEADKGEETGNTESFYSPPVTNPIVNLTINPTITTPIRGEKGETGAKGEKGETGAKGEKGETGAKGERGEDGADGKDGEDGKDGKDGKDGVSSYVHIRYADDAAGTNMTDAPMESSQYLGIYTGNLPTPPEQPESYQWSLYRDPTLDETIRDLQEQLAEL